MVLQIIQDLMLKSQDIFLDHFARLGVFSKVQQISSCEHSGLSTDDLTSCVDSLHLVRLLCWYFLHRRFYRRACLINDLFRMIRVNQKFTKMPKKFCLVEHTIGKIGVFVAVVIVCTFGPKLPLLNYQMAVMVGSVSSWMENYPLCTLVVVLKAELIVPVMITRMIYA